MDEEVIEAYPDSKPKIDIILEKVEALEKELKAFKEDIKRMEIKSDKALTLARAIADKVL